MEIQRPTLEQIHSLDTTEELSNFPQSEFRASDQTIPEHSVDLSEFNILRSVQNIKQELPQLGNVIPALPTLYHPDGAINLTALREMMEDYQKQGIQSVLIAGTTGESSLMSHSEQIQYIGAAVSYARELGLQVVAGSGANATFEQNYLTQQVFSARADAALLLPPYYLKSSVEEMGRHFWEAMNYGPCIIYSISGRTGIQIPLELIRELSEHPNFLGVKECDGQDRIQQLADWGIRVWTGNDDSAPRDIDTYGANGIISVTANIHPELMQAIANTEEHNRGNLIHYSHQLANLAFPAGLPNPGAIHSIAEMMRRATREINAPATFWAPVGPLSLLQQTWIQNGLESLGITSVMYKENHQRLSSIMNISNPREEVSS